MLDHRHCSDGLGCGRSVKIDNIVLIMKYVVICLLHDKRVHIVMHFIIIHAVLERCRILLDLGGQDQRLEQNGLAAPLILHVVQNIMEHVLISLNTKTAKQLDVLY